MDRAPVTGHERCGRTGCDTTVLTVTTDFLALFDDVATAVAGALDEIADLGPSGARDGQYGLDLVADEAALSVLRLTSSQLIAGC